MIWAGSRETLSAWQGEVGLGDRHEVPAGEALVWGKFKTEPAAEVSSLTSVILLSVCSLAPLTSQKLPHLTASAVSLVFPLTRQERFLIAISCQQLEGFISVRTRVAPLCVFKPRRRWETQGESKQE